jgi:mono/diheme cytochrome c family protein
VRGSLAALAALGVLAAGCGRAGTATTQAPPAETLFVQTCGACHRLVAAGTEGGVGADLDEKRRSRDAVLRAIADGPGNMPAALLTGAKAEAVAAYVSQVAGR